MIESLSKIIPSACVSCTKPTSATPLCPVCIEKFQVVGEMTDYPKSHWRNAVAAFSYNGPVVDLIHRFKYEQGEGLCKFISALSFPFAEQLPIPDIVIPVPLASKKLWKRGYNQAHSLAKSLAKKMKVEMVDNTLVCTRPHSQIGLGKTERTEMVKGSFAVENASNVKGKNVLLIDDVMTTGVTAAECSKQLINAGATSVDVFVIARP